MPVVLSKLIHSCAASVDRPGEGQECRFNRRERQEILGAIGYASRDELLRAAQLTEPGRPMPGSRRSWRAHAQVPLWNPTDSAFRLQLAEAINRRLAANTNRERPVVSANPSANANPSAKAGPSASPNASLRPNPGLAGSRGVAGASPGDGRRYAVLLIDAEYEGHTFRGEDVEAEQQEMARVLAAANAQGVPVFEVVWPGSYETSPTLAALRQASSWVRVEKDDQDAFCGTDLAEELAARGITDLILMGMFQDHCVRSTAVSADRLGYGLHTSARVLQGGDRYSPGDPNFNGWREIPGAHVVAAVDQLPLMIG